MAHLRWHSQEPASGCRPSRMPAESRCLRPRSPASQPQRLRRQLQDGSSNAEEPEVTGREDGSIAEGVSGAGEPAGAVGTFAPSPGVAKLRHSFRQPVHGFRPERVFPSPGRPGFRRSPPQPRRLQMGPRPEEAVARKRQPPAPPYRPRETWSGNGEPGFEDRSVWVARWPRHTNRKTPAGEIPGTGNAWNARQSAGVRSGWRRPVPRRRRRGVCREGEVFTIRSCSRV